MTPTIRGETAADYEAVRHVNRLAFGRDDEAGIVDALRNGGYTRLSLVAEVEGRVVGHILFSHLPILTDGGTVAALSLAPMAVLPEYQKRGVGSALVREGLAACREAGHRIVVVLGHPHFYPRFGFSAIQADPLSSPFGGRDSWMAMELVPGSLSHLFLAKVHQELRGEKPGADGVPGADGDVGAREEPVALGPLWCAAA